MTYGTLTCQDQSLNHVLSSLYMYVAGCGAVPPFAMMTAIA